MWVGPSGPAHIPEGLGFGNDTWASAAMLVPSIMAGHVPSDDTPRGVHAGEGKVRSKGA